MPNDVSIHIETPRGRKSLKLKRNYDSTLPPLVHVTGESHSRDITRQIAESHRSVAHYQDLNTGAAVMLKRATSVDDGKYEVYGSYFHGNLKYGIEPASDNLYTGKLRHRVGLVKSQEAFLHENAIKRMKTSQKTAIQEHMEREIDERKVRKTRRRRVANMAQCETGYYIGVTEYEHLRDLFNAQQFFPNQSSSGSDTVLSFITYYIGYINNEVDLRYVSFEESSSAQAGEYGLDIVYSHVDIYTVMENHDDSCEDDENEMTHITLMSYDFQTPWPSIAVPKDRMQRTGTARVQFIQTHSTDEILEIVVQYKYLKQFKYPTFTPFPVHCVDLIVR